MRVHLVEPHSSGRISGGYLYNHRIAEGAPDLELHAVQLATLDRDLAALDLGGPAVVLADSLFCTPELMAPFFPLRRGGRRLGVLLHAFPSFVERAGDRALLSSALPLLPTPDELAVLDQLDLVVAPGPYIPRLLRQCRARVRCIICPPGIDPSGPRRHAERGLAAPVRMISMGGVTPIKGLADAMLALGDIKSDAWRWTIVGHVGLAPEHVQSLQQMARSRGLETRVHFTGQQGHEATLAELRQSDLLLVPSYTENHPLVALEALAAGVPVVGYEVGGLPDIIRHEQTGLLAPLLDVTTLSAHLDRLVDNPEMRERLSRNCLEAAQKLLTWPEAARHFLASLRGGAPASGPGAASDERV
jgi:glycosyltransferase involved in cell wall biosynthesis